MERAKSAATKGRQLVIDWADGASSASYPNMWLRDHCQCAECLHPETKQRLLDTFSIPDDIEARSVGVVDDGATVEIVWDNDGHVSHYDVSFLKSVDDATRSDFGPERTLWDAEALKGFSAEIECAPFMKDEKVLGQALKHLERYGFVFITGIEPTEEATEAVARRIAYIRETIFGGFWAFTANMEHKDTAYTTLKIGSHTDGTYSFDAPGYQMFHCLAFEGEGGDSTLVDGFCVAEAMRREAPELFHILTEVTVPGQYLDYERGVHLMDRKPIFRTDAHGRMEQIRYNNHDRAPFLIDADRMALFYKALKMLDSMVQDPAFMLRKRLGPGEMLIFDNWRTLHGREAYRGHRKLAGAYLNKEDVESRLRVLRRQGIVD